MLKKMRRRTGIGLLSVIVAFSFGVNFAAADNDPASQPSWVNLTPDNSSPELLENPLKGFMPYTSVYDSAVKPAFPHSLEWFYIPLKEVMDGPNHYTFDTGLEPILNAIASRGHQAVFRFYLDYPDRSSGIPQFLLDGGLQVREETIAELGNVKVHSPDYDDPKLVAALTSFIHTFGEKYDGDPRIGFIETGLIGFWGEWHTWPNSDWMASPKTQNDVHKAFDDAFDITKLLTRYPDSNNVKQNIGFHDDSFAYETLGTESYYFYNRLKDYGATEVWKKEPIGGELRPAIQTSIWANPDGDQTAAEMDGSVLNNTSVDSPVDPNKVVQSFATSVETTHASWLNAHQLFLAAFPTSGDAYDRALAGSKKLGYELSVSAVKVPAASRDGSLPVSIRMRNTGVAPFYYNWDIELGAVTRKGALVRKWKAAGWKLSEVIPGESDRTMDYTIPNLALPGGDYTLVMRAVNPLAQGKPLKFANKEQDANLKNWLSLTDFKVSGSTMKWEVSTIDRNGVTYVPVRPFIEGMGGTVEWVQSERSFRLILNGKNVIVAADDKQVKPWGINSRMYVPLKWLTEWTGAKLDSERRVFTAPIQASYDDLVPLSDGTGQAAIPGMPLNLLAVSTTSQSVTLSWSAADTGTEAIQYEIYRNGVKIGSVKGTSYKDGGVKAGVIYVYTVKAIDVKGTASLPSRPLKIVPDASISYETESGKLKGAAVRSECPSCSGGYKAGYIGNNDGAVTFDVIVDKAGAYTLAMHYIAGELRSAEIGVNAAEPVPFRFKPSGGWDVVAVSRLAVSLKAGANTIRIFNTKGYTPDLDRITLTAGTAGISDNEQAEQPKEAPIVNIDPNGSDMKSLSLDNFDNNPVWPGTNDLGKWAGANSFVVDGGEIDNGALKLTYKGNGWLGSSVETDLIDYPYLMLRIKGASGGEQNGFMLKIGEVEKKFSEWTGDPITQEYKDIVIDLKAAGVSLTAPGQLQMSFWHGQTSAIWLDDIRFVGKK
ncbi:stalk domain-containing protein [Cohnella silvisoli]|uniref:Stalk domain-containing protein n=1 Tax=Cohnella silvisoli TaxID=2873699 RepID=A0ABV1L3E9_9BACL|nr:DUF4832 domain-containing protein [Cohnella silvisoli]MCD9026202.1 DUF4832 domain-containing protein [Cohnella silvisoli]